MLTVTLDQKVLSDFCKATLKVAKSAKYVRLKHAKGTLTLSTQTETGSVFYSTKTNKVDDVTGGFSYPKFSACINRLADAGITLTLSKRQANIKQANVSVNLPLVDDTITKPPQIEFSLSASASSFVVQSLKDAFISFGNTDKNFRYAGMLIDLGEHSVNIVKIDNFMIKMSQLNEPTGAIIRSVVPCYAGDLCKLFSKQLNKVVFGYNKVGFCLDNGIYAYVAELQDDYPVNYGAYLDQKVLETITIEKEDLSQTIDLIASITGHDNTDIVLKVSGFDQKTQHAVIEISSKTFDGTSATELLVTQGQLKEIFEPVKVKSTQFLAALRPYTGVLYLDVTQRFCLLRDKDFKHRTIVSTMSM